MVKERGQVMVLFALVFVVLMLFCGLVVDVGWIYINKVRMQNALDATALAAIHEVLNNSGQVQTTAIHYARDNGIKTSELTVTHPFEGDPNKLQLTATRNLPLLILSVVGFDEIPITVKAVSKIEYTTETITNDVALDYAIFSAGPGPMVVQGINSVVNGNVHGNDTIEYKGKGHSVKGNVTCGRDLKGAANVTISGTTQTKVAQLPIPDLGFEQLAAKATTVFEGDQTFNNVTIEGIWLVNGNLRLTGGRIRGKGVLLARGAIDLPGNSLEYSSSNDLLAIYALADVNISTTKSNVQGIIYAPNGEIRINGSNNTFFGSLIANRITWASSDIVINGNYDYRAPSAFTTSKPKISLAN